MSGLPANDETQRHVAIYVHLLPGLIPPGALKGGMAVVVDVLRATTVMVHALASGCEAIVPCGEIEEARKVAAGYPQGTVLLAGEREGLPIEGFDLGNSPREFTPEVCGGKTVVMTTTNGTRAILASLEAERVLVASFWNMWATADEISVQLLKKDHGHAVHIVCSGTDGHVSLEDSMLAGALVKAVVNATHDTLGNAIFGNDEAYIVLSQWLATENYQKERPLSQLMGLGRGGQNVRRIGRAIDIEDATVIVRRPLVAELRRDPLRIVKV